MNYKHSISLFFSFLLISGLCHGTEYYFRPYSVKDGIPQSQVFSILQASSGYLWIGTGGGLASYDGVEIRNYSSKDGLESASVRCIYEDSKGELWIGTYGGGIVNYNGKEFKSFQAEKDHAYEVIRSIIETKSGEVYFGTDGGGIFILKDKKLVPLKIGNFKNNALRVWDFHEFGEGKFLVGTLGDGLFQLKNNELIKLSGAEFTDVRSVCKLKNNNYLLGTETGVWSFNGQSFSRFNIQGYPELGTVNSVFEDSKGNIWIGSSVKGLLKISNNSVKAFSEESGLTSSNIISIEEDKDANIWVGTNGMGMFKAEELMFQNYGRLSGLEDPNIWTISQNKEGEIYCGSNSLGVYALDAHGFRKIDAINNIENNRVWTSIKDNKGSNWFGTDNGIIVLNNGNIRKITKQDGLPGNSVISLLQDRKGNYWVGTYGKGAAKMESDKYSYITTESGLASNNVWALFEDSKGRIWFGTDRGISCLDNGKINNISKKDGLSNNVILSFKEDTKGNIWVATYGGGINVLKQVSSGFKVNIISAREGLANDHIMFMLPDDEYMWVGTYKGLNRINLNNYIDSGIIKLDYFGVDEGFLGMECNLNASFKDEQGNLWFGTTNGVLKFDRHAQRIDNLIESRTYIRKIKIGQKELAQNNNIKLAHDQNQLSFDFIGISFTNPQKVKYKHILEGMEQHWSEPLSSNSVSYSGLSPGNYVFKVISSNEDGLWNKEPVRFAFTIQPPFWKRWWFYLLEIVFTVTGIVVIYRIRTQSLRNQKKYLEQKVSERTAELETKNFEIESQKSSLLEKNKEITDSIVYAKRIQDAILKEEAHVTEHLPPHFVYFRPRNIVSGDFHWGVEKKDCFYIAVADCTGHGVPGAFLTMLGIAFLNEITSGEKDLSPAEILDLLREKLNKELSKDSYKDENSSEIVMRDGMDISLIKLSLNSNEIQWAGANNPLWLIRKNKAMKNRVLTEFKPDKQSIGYSERQTPFTNHLISLEKGDSVYIFSDGYADQFGGEHGKKFKYSQLKTLLCSICEKPIEEQKRILHTTFENWKGNLEQVDDVCIIGFGV